MAIIRRWKLVKSDVNWKTKWIKYLNKIIKSSKSEKE